MGTVTATMNTRPSGTATTNLSRHLILYTWAAMGQADTGSAVELGNYADCTIQFDGTFGAGGTVVFEGSNDGSTYFTLTDAQASAISKSAAALEQVAEMVLFMRPRVTAGDGTTAINARLLGRRSVEWT